MKHLVEQIRKEIPEGADTRIIISKIWENQSIKDEIPTNIIRLEELRTVISNVILKERGHVEQMLNLTLGAITEPDENPEFKQFLDTIDPIRTNFSKHPNLNLEQAQLEYDLQSLGQEKVRKMVLTYLQKFYGFPNKYIDQIVQGSAITTGGVQTLADIVTSSVENSIKEQKVQRFIQPTNSFALWFAHIGQTKLGRDKNVESHTIDVYDENSLHLTPEDIDSFYSSEINNHEKYNDTWYITPMSNPAGTIIPKEQLEEVCKNIVKKNPSATIILDTVYIRTLGEEKSKDLMEGVIDNDEVMNRIVFVESLSKSHGLCRNRVGFSFSKNADLYRSVHQSKARQSGGAGSDKDRIWAIASNPTENDKIGIKKLYESWRNEREGLYNFLMNDPKCSGIFAVDQPHMKNNGGIYLCPRLDDDFVEKYASNLQVELISRTGLVGIPVKLEKDSKYPTHIRYSVGMFKSPTFIRNDN